jgi:accessory colonization factor AcfC
LVTIAFICVLGLRCELPNNRELANIKTVAVNSGIAREQWIKDTTLAAWITWANWQFSNPTLATLSQLRKIPRFIEIAEWVLR